MPRPNDHNHEPTGPFGKSPRKNEDANPKMLFGGMMSSGEALMLAAESTATIAEMDGSRVAILIMCHGHDVDKPKGRYVHATMVPGGVHEARDFEEAIIYFLRSMASGARLENMPNRVQIEQCLAMCSDVFPHIQTKDPDKPIEDGKPDGDKPDAT